MKKLIGIVAFAAGVLIGAYGSCGASSVEQTNIDWKQMFLKERKECILWRNIAHQYWQFRDYDCWPDSCDEPIGRHNFFDDCISETDTYDQLNELLEGDFEDFFCDWESHYEELNF